MTNKELLYIILANKGVFLRERAPIFIFYTLMEKKIPVTASKYWAKRVDINIQEVFL